MPNNSQSDTLDLLDLARMTVGRNFSADEWSLYFPGEEYRKTFEQITRLQRERKIIPNITQTKLAQTNFSPS
jgi:hypothetical protein